MSSTLPDQIDPWRAVETGAEYGGTLPLSHLPRLRDTLWDVDGDAQLRLVFSRDAENRGIARGAVRASLRLTCQRCLGPFAYAVDAAIELALVSGVDEACRLPEGYDPLLVPDGLIRLADLVEDELLLVLPQIPMHAPGDCKPAADRLVVSRESARSGEEAHPFAVLADWKGGKGRS